MSLTGAIWSVGESLVNLLHSSAVLQVYPEDGQGRDVVRRDVGSVGRKVRFLDTEIHNIVYTYRCTYTCTLGRIKEVGHA